MRPEPLVPSSVLLLCGERGIETGVAAPKRLFRQWQGVPPNPFPSPPRKSLVESQQDFMRVTSRGPQRSPLGGPRRERGCAGSPLPRGSLTCSGRTTRRTGTGVPTTPCFPYRGIICKTTTSLLFSRFLKCSSHYLESNVRSLPSRIQVSLLSSSPLPPPVVLASGPPRLSQPTLAKLLRRRHEFLGRSGKSSGQERLRAPPPGCAYKRSERVAGA